MPSAGLRLLPPGQPAGFRDFVAFEEHVQGAAAITGDAATAIVVWHAQPRYLYGSPHAMVGSGDTVAAPPGSQALDFELEVGVGDRP